MLHTISNCLIRIRQRARSESIGRKLDLLRHIAPSSDSEPTPSGPSIVHGGLLSLEDAVKTRLWLLLQTFLTTNKAFSGRFLPRKQGDIAIPDFCPGISDISEELLDEAVTDPVADNLNATAADEDIDVQGIAESQCLEQDKMLDDEAYLSDDFEASLLDESELTSSNDKIWVDHDEVIPSRPSFQNPFNIPDTVTGLEQDEDTVQVLFDEESQSYCSQNAMACKQLDENDGMLFTTQPQYWPLSHESDEDMLENIYIDMETGNGECYEGKYEIGTDPGQLMILDGQEEMLV